MMFSEVATVPHLARLRDVDHDPHRECQSGECSEGCGVWTGPDFDVPMANSAYELKRTGEVCPLHLKDSVDISACRAR